MRCNESFMFDVTTNKWNVIFNLFPFSSHAKLHENAKKYLLRTWTVMFYKWFPFSHAPSPSFRIVPFENSRNDLRKVLEESDDSFGDLETTKKTTTSTTTQPPPTVKSTTFVTTTKGTTAQRSTKRYYAPSKNPDDVPKTPKTYFSNSFYHNNNQNNINGQTDKVQKGVTQVAQFDTQTPAPAKSTINPFYYGFNRLPQYNSTTTQKSSRHLNYFTTTARTPYVFQYFTPSKKVDLLVSPTPSSNYEVDNNFYENQSPPRDDVETDKPSSSTYNPVFDIYFKQIGRQRAISTNNPYG